MTVYVTVSCDKYWKVAPLLDLKAEATKAALRKRKIRGEWSNPKALNFIKRF